MPSAADQSSILPLAVVEVRWSSVVANVRESAGMTTYVIRYVNNPPATSFNCCQVHRLPGPRRSDALAASATTIASRVPRVPVVNARAHQPMPISAIPARRVRAVAGTYAKERVTSGNVQVCH
jgi:hypothetical protein